MPLAQAQDDLYGRWNTEMQYFQWREYQDSGAPFLEESGFRLAMGFDEQNFTRRVLPGLVYRGSVKGFIGRVGYHGGTNGGTSASTSVNYAGGKLDGFLGNRYGYIDGRYGLDAGVGGSLDGWFRQLLDTTDSAGNPAQGYYEIYVVASAKAGIGLSFRNGDQRGYAQVGVKMPVVTRERVSLNGADLTPGRRPSLYARFELTNVFPAVRNGISLAASLETFRFAASNTVSGVQQPKSSMDVVSLSLAF